MIEPISAKLCFCLMFSKNEIDITQEKYNIKIETWKSDENNAKILYECDRFDMKSMKYLKGDKKYYLSDIFSFLSNPDSSINYGPVLENIVYIYTKSKDYTVSIGRIGILECDFILKNKFLDYSYVKVSYTIANSKDTEEREYKALELIKGNYPKYLIITDYLIKKKNGIKHINLIDFIVNGELF